MSKTGQWVLGMQEDATWMTKEEFIKEHGINQVDIWEQVQNGDDGYNEDGFLDNDYGQQFQN
jgi:hypothetical protein|tara:strand:+ start:1197 stop:1382 length:186 start_codon:yes stop_codon:yes gene_type:complete